MANIAVGIFYTPYLIESLGIIAYGVIPIALTINQYISVVTGSLTSSLTRFYSIAIQKGNNDEASKYLSTSFLVILAIIAILVFPLWYLISNIENIFSIPIDLINDSKVLFQFTIISFFCSLISSVFNITLYAYNRLDLLNVVKIIRVSGKLLFVVLLFTLLEVNISYVGLASLITEVILLVFSVFVFYRFSINKIKLNLFNFNNKALKVIALMAFWVIIQQLGDTGIYRIDNLLVNMFWTSKESGILGAFTELGNYSIVLASVIGSLFGPLILMAYSDNDHERVVQITLDRSLSVGVLVAVMIGALIGFSSIILKIWIGEEFVAYSLWLTLKLGLVPFYSAAGVFAFAARAWNKVRFPAIATIIFGGVNFGALYFLAVLSENDISYVNYMLAFGLVVGILQSYFLNGLYFSKIYKGTKTVVLMNFFKILLVLLIVSCVSFITSPFLDRLNNVLALILILLISSILLVISVKLVLSKKQLNSIVALVYKK